MNVNFEAIEKAWFKPKKTVLDELEEWIEDRISILTISVDNKVKDQYFNNKCIGGVQELKHIKKTIRELKKGDEINDRRKNIN